MQRITKLAPFALLVASLGAQPAQVPTTSPPRTIAAVLDAAVQNLIRLVDRPDLAVAELEVISQCVGIGAAVPANPQPVPGTLPAVIEAAIASARAGFLTYFEAAFVREQLIEARLDRVLRVLELRAESTGWDPAVYEEVVATLVTRARVAVDYPDAEAARARLEVILAAIRAQYAGGPLPLESVRLELLRGRIERYHQFLRGRALALGLEPGVVAPYLALLVERARLVALGG